MTDTTIETSQPITAGCWLCDTRINLIPTIVTDTAGRTQLIHQGRRESCPECRNTLTMPQCDSDHVWVDVRDDTTSTITCAACLTRRRPTPIAILDGS